MSFAALSAEGDAQRDAAEALPVGTRLAEFELRGLLGLGGFGIVYLAWDHALEREVALKEYMPVSLAGRGKGSRVTLRSQAQRETFDIGLRSFVNEARMLARFDHPSLVKVYRFWEDHGTAYMVMPFYRGRTLRQVRQGMVDAPAEAQCRRVLEPLLSALALLHSEGVYHRDIAPDNIIIGADGAPVLLDFGAARQVINRTQSLTAILKPNFAPLEQYADMASMRQGPWTDFYALGATMYYFITAQPPLPAAARALNDELSRLAVQVYEGCSLSFLSTIDWMLALRPPERPQSVAEILETLSTGVVPSPVHGEGYGEARPHGWSTQAPQDAAVLAFEPTAPMLTAAPVTAAESPRRRRVWQAAMLGGMAVIGTLAWWFAKPEPTRPAAAMPAASVPAAASVSIDAPAQAPPPVSTAAAPGPPPAPVPPVAQRTIADATPSASASAADRVPPQHPRPRAARRPATEVVEGPRERCSERRFIALLVCMKRECERPKLRSHPECRRMAALEQAQRESQMP